MKKKSKLFTIILVVVLASVLILVSNLASRKSIQKYHTGENSGYVEYVRVEEGFPLNHTSYYEYATTYKTEISEQKVVLNIIFWLVVSYALIKSRRWLKSK